MDGRCPACAGELTGGRLGPITLALCLPCGGVLLPSESLRQLLEAGPDIVRRLAGKLSGTASGGVPKAGPCPSCPSPLSPSTSSALPGIVIHACNACRVFWLSRASLFRIAEVLDRNRSGGEATPTSDPTSPSGNPNPARAANPASRRTPHGTTCPDCGETNGASASCCWACSRLLKGVVARACPRCRGVVLRLENPDVRIGVCESCGGAWFPPGQLNALFFLPEDDQHGVLRGVQRLHSARARPFLPACACSECEVPLTQITVGKLSDRPVPACPSCRANFTEPELLEELVLGKRARPRPAVRVVS